MLLVWGSVCVSKTIIPDAQEHFLTPSAHRDTYLFGGLELKRGYQGIYHWFSVKHLHRYVSEFEGRHNDRPLDTIDQMAAIVQEMMGRRLRYSDLIGPVETRLGGQMTLA